MSEKDIFIDFKDNDATQFNNIHLFNNSNITKNSKHKKKNIKLENTKSKKSLSKDNYDFVCEYIELLVVTEDKK